MTGAYAVRGLVVSPFNSGLRMRAYGIMSSSLYGRTMGDESCVVADLRQGCVYAPEEEYVPLCYGMNKAQFEAASARKRVLAGDTSASEDLEKWMKRPEYQQRLPGWFQELYGVASALAAGRVSASELEKGLKARGLVMPGKAINNYLGGWSFYLDDDLEREVIATAFMYKCFKQWGK